MAIKLPWDITVTILSRLPVDDLLRFRSVCKQWRSLIDGPDFINLHLSRSTETRIVFGGRNELEWVDPKALDSPEWLRSPVNTARGVCVIGSCHGLMAVSNADGDIAIWNPSTWRHVTLPPLVQALVVGYFEVTLLGFGHDPVTDDYKVVRVVVYRCIAMPGFVEVDVYSLKAKAWKRIKPFPGHLSYDRPGNGVLVNGSLHWFVTRASSDSSDSLLAFDLGTEEPREVPLPGKLGFKNPCLRMTNLGGRLCVSILGRFNAQFRKAEQMDVWVMEEYGVGESWTKLYSVEAQSSAALFDFAIPVVYLKKDVVLMNWDGERFLAYDLNAERVKKVKGPCVSRIVDTLVCVRSLVKVGNDSVGKKPKKTQKKKKNNKKRDDFLSKGFKLVL